ncbi:Site-specific DNA-methyltransferase (adenine- specific) [Streptococcus mutans 24]|nr:Site-specific DNA-methyltransferase (adenine- specific) [Streptococcus mutans 24]
MSQDFNERPRKNEKDGAITYVQELLKQAREDRRNEDVDKLENLVRLLNTKKYGLVWEEHAELVEEEMKTKIPVFVEDETKKIVGNPDSEDYNFLLEGDNLHSLHLLKKTHAGKIDVIYIDPPYNTGNKDFIYNDKIVDKNDGYSHSKWLSFMSKRLELARELMSNSGLIFISIDNNEQAQLKLLCDSVFG